MNELKNELKIELSCGNCSFTKTITICLDKDGVFTIPDKFCPKDLSELSRDVLRRFVSEPDKQKLPEPLINSLAPLLEESEPKQNEPTENKTEPTNAVSKPARALGLPKNRPNSSEKTKR